MVTATKTKKPRPSKNGKPKREAEPAADDVPAALPPSEVTGPADEIAPAEGATDTAASETTPAESATSDAPGETIPAPAETNDDPTTPEALARYDAETVVLVNAMADAVKEAESDADAANEVHKSAKKAYEVKQEELRDLIRDRRERRGKRPQRDLFTGVEDKPHDPAAPTPTAEADPLETLWQKFPIGGDRLDQWIEWGLTEKDVEKLNAGEIKGDDRRSPILVMGDVNRFVTPNPNAPAYSRPLTEIKGFGPAAFDRWQEAEVKFWGWWNNFGGRAEFAKEQGVGGEAQPGTDAGGGGGGDGDGAGQPAEPVTNADVIETVGQ